MGIIGDINSFEIELEAQTIEKEYSVNNLPIKAVITNDNDLKKELLVDYGLFDQIVKNMNDIYGQVYATEYEKRLKSTFLAEGYMFLTYNKKSSEFQYFGFNKIHRRRNGNTFNDLWDGDYTVESSSGIRNRKFATLNFGTQFKDFLRSETKLRMHYVNSGYQYWGIGRVLWSSHIMLKYYPADLIHGFFLQPKLIKTLWDTTSYLHFMSLGIRKSNEIRLNLTSKTEYPNNLRDQILENSIMCYLKDYEGSQASDFKITPIKRNVKETQVDATLILLSANDLNSVMNYINDGYRICAILPSRIFEKGMFHSLIMLQRINSCEQFPRLVPERQKWVKNIPNWPPKISVLTNCFIELFKVLESLPKDERNYFPWVPEKEIDFKPIDGSDVLNYINYCQKANRTILGY